MASIIWLEPEYGYTIGRLKPDDIRAFRYQGMIFHVHRPVCKGRKLTADWQFSKDGKALMTLGGITAHQATNYFVEKFEMAGFQFDPDEASLM